MSHRFNWERANLHKKAKRSLSDEREFMERDRAAKWLERRERRQQTRSAKAPQSRGAPSAARSGNDQTCGCPGASIDEKDDTVRCDE
jgi:hypothetical protein